MLAFTRSLIAHRGLFDNKGDAPENSLKAFQKAVDGGYGIELDIQITKDDEIIVFHDNTLERMCGENKSIINSTYQEIKDYKLLNSDEKIPLFSEMLALVNGKSPLIIELKSEMAPKKRIDVFCKKVCNCLQNYKGLYTVQSFDPLIVLWFKKNRPELIRGILSTNYQKDAEGLDFIRSFILKNLLLNFFIKPDYIAYNQKYRRQTSFLICKKLYNPITIGWTLKTQEKLDAAKKDYDGLIFDSFVPK